MSYSKYFFLFFAFLFLSSFLISFVSASGIKISPKCTCYTNQNQEIKSIGCESKLNLDLNLDQFNTYCSDFNYISVTLHPSNLKKRNVTFHNTNLNITNRTISVNSSGDNATIDINFDTSKSFILGGIYFITDGNLILRNDKKNLSISHLQIDTNVLKETDVNIYGLKQISNFDLNGAFFLSINNESNKYRTNLFISNNKLFFDTLNFDDLNINIDSNKKALDINKMSILNSNVTDKDPIILGHGDFKDSNNLDLNLIVSKDFNPINDHFIDLDSVGETSVDKSYIKINYNPEISNAKNFYNLVKMNSSGNVNLKGNVNFNKLDELTKGPKTMFDINYSNFIFIHGFKFYSEESNYKNDDLNYFKIKDSLIYLYYNVFNNANYIMTNPGKNQVALFSNSFYNNKFIFNNISDTNFVFFNNFVLDSNLYNSKGSNVGEYDLQYGTDENKNKSFGDKENNCKITIDDPFLKNKDLNIPLYYINNKGDFVKESFTPKCIGGNLYGDKTIPALCEKDNKCFDISKELKGGKPDFVNDTPYTVQGDLNDFAPLIDYRGLTFNQNADLFMQIQLPKENLDATQKIDFNLIIQPKSKAGSLLTNNNNFIFNKLDVNLNKKSITKIINTNAIKLACDKINPIQRTFCFLISSDYNKITLKDTNFGLSQFNILNSGKYNINFTLDYNRIDNVAQAFFCPSSSDCSYDNANSTCNCHYTISAPGSIYIKGSLKTVKTPDNNLFVIFGLMIVVIGMYLYKVRNKKD